MKDDIIRMAREADLGVYLAPQWQLYEQLERFFHAAYAAGAADEREACAKVCEDKWGTHDEADIFAAAIRERGKT